MIRHNAIAVGLAMALASCSSNSSNNQKTQREGLLTLFALADLRGTIEPCGCNSDPLGDIARTVEQVTRARADGRAVLVVDAGSLLYTAPGIPEHRRAEEALRSDLVASIYRDSLDVAAVGLGPYDLAAGADRVRPPRQVANLAPDSGIATESPKVVTAGGVRVGLFGVTSPGALAPLGVTATDPAAAATEAVRVLRGQGAQVVVGLAHMTATEASKLARAVPGIDFLVVGQNAPEPHEVKDQATRVGDTYLVAPANRGQVISRIDLAVRGSGPFTDAIGEARAASDIADLAGRIADLTARLASWQADPTADPAFVAGKRHELAELQRQKASLEKAPLQAPDRGSYFTLDQIEVRKALPCDTRVQAAKQAFDRAAGLANREAARGQQPAAPAPGEAGYVGVAACEDCHDEAVAFWKKTKHYLAWETLEKVGKPWSYECISCHVTGWDRPGGSTLAVNEHLRDVQCETCHGPGSIHVAEDGADEPVTVVRAPPESLCQTCHNAEHSDTFQFEAYLRDVTGPGHGAEFRAALGDGPTGLELRTAALDKAGKAIGAGCVK